MRLSDLVRQGGSRPAPPRTATPTPPAAPREAAPPEPLSDWLGALVRKIEEAGPATGIDAAESVFQTVVERVTDIHRTVRDSPISIAQVEEAAEALLRSLTTSDALLVPFFRGGGARSPAREAVNVCILSTKVGTELSYEPHELRALALAALLCDIGLTRVPGSIMDKREPLTASERALLQTHQREGAKVLHALVPQHPWLAGVVLERYERAHGAREPENRFEEYAAIIHLAAVYDSLVNPRPPRERLNPLDALKHILERQRALFPDRLLKGLIRAMSTFPVGTLVRLNSGDIGRVVTGNRDYPLRPVVEILVRRGQRLEGRVLVDLTQSPLLHIKESVAEESLP